MVNVRRILTGSWFSGQAVQPWQLGSRFSVVFAAGLLDLSRVLLRSVGAAVFLMVSCQPWMLFQPRVCSVSQAETTDLDSILTGQIKRTPFFVVRG